MKILNGLELAGFIKERQAKAVRSLIQAHRVQPKLAIVQTNDSPVINTYVRLKKRYGADILVEVDIHFVKESDVPSLLKELNQDASIHGIIIQLPLSDTSQTETIVELVSPNKDVDALGSQAKFEPATPLAIMWLLSGYNVELNGKHILLVGRGKLVGRPLEKILKESGQDVEMIGRDSNLAEKVKQADIIITATGNPAVIHADMIKKGAVVVDAGVASESGKTVGDLAPDVYEREDLTITPTKGGVGPLTVCALFENTISAARQAADSKIKDESLNTA